MPCSTFRTAPTTLGKALRDAFGPGADSVAIEQGRADDIIPASEGPVFMCGSLVVEVCACGIAADFLCDWPVGDGKTCDARLCVVCAREIGEDRHACEIHWHMFQQQTGVARMRPRGPRIVR